MNLLAQKKWKAESPIINWKYWPKNDPLMTDDVNNQLHWEDDEFLIDGEQHPCDFQNENDIDHMEVEVVRMVDQINDPLIQYVYMRS